MARERAESVEAWRGLVDEWERSGLPAEEFARRRGVAWSQLKWWAGRLRKLASPAPAATGMEFVELVAPTTGIALEVVLRGGAVLRLPVGFDEDTLLRAVRVLDGAAP